MHLELKKADVKVYSFADDLTISIFGDHMDMIHRDYTLAIKIIEDWMARFKHRISKEKCNAIFFGPRYGGCGKTFMKEFEFLIQGEPLRVSTSMKYLGVIVDQNLNFINHITKMSEKTKKTYFQLLRVCGNTWGANYKNRRILY